MKTIKISLMALAVCFLSFESNASTKVLSKNEKVNAKPISIKWKAEEVDLNQIPKNIPVSVDFEFANTGDAPVVITSVQTSCGCTVADYSHAPILPGESTKITATYNAANLGAFHKAITVITNAEETPKVLIIKGTVI